MNRVRRLLDPATGKTWSTRCDGELVIISNGFPGKEKHADKPKADAETARIWAEKEEWARLKKNMVLVTPDAAPGEPRMHCYLGGAYTGSLALADVGGRIMCSRSGDSEHLVFVSADGVISKPMDLPPNRLAWKIIHAPALDRVLVQADDQVIAWSDASGAFEALTESRARHGSFLDAAGTRIAWYDAPDVVVKDIATGKELFRRKFEAQIYKGSVQMTGALSPDGSTVAACAQEGEVVLFDIASGESRTWQGSFTQIDKLEFSGDGRWLIAKGRYAGWGLHCFDVAAGAARTDWPDLGDLGNGDFAIDPTGTRLAVTHRGHIEVFDLATMQSVLRFRVEHIVRRADIAWMGTDTIAVRTDYACASLYAV
ncbi:PQQ-binding-like beta-propeller repeat protein [Pigmentiphaga aceris]|uniref:PQQ-binding-like beta-propeller repeat protein n=1 Tax=Pigmentiphaga aceris TaxID=1940612 RepID=A0A5C0AVL9_9BURK|nr:WD40 repeat domain-containing protein [Pigmentiphaga aceris]QEI06245.1 PQQ-binding-like beta-propeller repeat protein [Pigmentiphaga aceris]